MERETWINEILSSTECIIKVVPDAILFSKIQSRIAKENKLTPQWIWTVAASFAVLIILNIAIVFSNNSKSKVQTEIIVATMSKSNQLY